MIHGGAASLEMPSSWFFENGWEDYFTILGGLTYRRKVFGYYENLFRLSPEYTADDVLSIDKGSALSLPALLPVMLGFNYGHVTRFGCPILLFECRHDDTTPSEIAARWAGCRRPPGSSSVSKTRRTW
jgi:hypothetical protein